MAEKITINLDKERHLHYSLNSLINLEEKLGIPISEIGNARLSIKNIRSFLHAGLVHEDKGLTEEMVGEFVTLENIKEAQEKIVQAFNQTSPKNS
jgi:hypothetical protein